MILRFHQAARTADLKIHYDRVGKDGLFGHKEVTVLYIPDLSNCLPSVDAWRDQWLAHKKAIAERERLHALKREISQGKKEGLKDKEPGTTKDLKKDAKPEKKKASGSSGSASKVIEKAKGKVKESGKEEVQSNTVTEKKGGVETIGEGDNSEKINQIEVAPVQTIGSGKKKVIRKVIKKKVVEKDKAEKAAEQSDSLVPKKVEETTTNTEASGRDEESSGNPSAVKTFTRKKLIKKVPVATAVKKKDESTQSEVIPVKEQESSENKPKNADAGSASGKTTVKKKII